MDACESITRSWYHKIPESFSAFCRIVSLTAAKTRRMFDVSVAWVRLEWVSMALQLSCCFVLLLSLQFQSAEV